MEGSEGSCVSSGLSRPDFRIVCIALYDGLGVYFRAALQAASRRSGVYWSESLSSAMPPEHQEYLQWNGERFLRWAEQIGAHTAAVVRLLLTANKVEQQGYKSCMALLKLADKYSAPRLEAACKKALSFTPTPSLKVIQSILKSSQDQLLEQEPETAPSKAAPYSFTRGAEYYRRDK